MEETLPRLETRSSKMYTLLDHENENQEEENLPKTPGGLSRALTDPGSLAMSEGITEAAINMPVEVRTTF